MLAFNLKERPLMLPKMNSLKYFLGVALIFFFVFSGDLYARPALAVLEYHSKDSLEEATTRFSDRLREEFIRRYQRAVLTKTETQDLFFYHRDEALRMGLLPGLPELVKAKKAYFELRLDEAESLLTKLIQSEGWEVRPDAYLLLGLVALAKNDEMKAREAFGQTLRLDPDRHLDAQFFSPKVVRLFDSMIRDQTKKGGNLTIEAQPIGSQVWINGVFRGVAPLQIKNFPVGSHFIRIQADHFQTSLKKVELSLEKEVSLKVSLTWLGRESEPSILGFNATEVSDGERLTPVAASVGSAMGVSKVLLVSVRHDKKIDEVETRLVDVSLGAVHRFQTYPVSRLKETSAETAALVVQDLAKHFDEDLKKNPGRYADNRFEGDFVLLGKYRKPFYRRPVFWVLVGATGATGGAAAAVLGGGAAATGALGLAF